MVGKLGLEPEDQDYMFSEDTVNKLVKHGYTNEEFEHPYFDEHKEKLAGFDNEARDNLYINRLAARVYNLRHRDGYPIDRKMITVKRPNRRSVSFAKYYLDSDAD